MFTIFATENILVFQLNAQGHLEQQTYLHHLDKR